MKTRPTFLLALMIILFLLMNSLAFSQTVPTPQGPPSYDLNGDGREDWCFPWNSKGFLVRLRAFACRIN